MSWSADIVLSSLGAIAGVVSVIKSLIDLKKSAHNIQLKLEDGTKLELPPAITAEEIKKLIDKLEMTPDIVKVLSEKKEIGDKGFVTVEFLMYFVPGVIALAFASTFIYLIIKHQDVAGYSIPKELSSAMTTIIGYFFGLGVSNAANKGKTLTARDIKKIIAESAQ